MRLTAPSMAAAVRDGLLAEGVTVLDAGMVATEMLYHLVGSRELDGGAMVTASHNPKAYTGIKLVREGALPLSGDAGIGDVQAEIEPARAGRARAAARFEEVDIWDEFHRHALSFIDPAIRPMKVVVDGGNGMGGPMVGPILAGSASSSWRRCTSSPTASSPTTSPTRCCQENRKLIEDRVRGTGADLGIAWDGDADRCFFIDANGEFCDGDFVCALLARAALAKNPGGMILYDPRSSRAVPDLVAAEGGRSGLSRVGHAFFKARMREEQAVFGGEVSGHYYFRDFWNADSGTIPALLMLELLSTGGRSLAELIADFRSRYFISGEINSEVVDQEAKIEEILARYGEGAEITSLDGVSIDYPGLALQRPPLEHRAAAAAQPRVARLPRGHGIQTGRDPRIDPGVSLTPEQALEQAALAGIHCLPIPTPFAVGRVNCYLIEDQPLTLIDPGPNSGKALDELQTLLRERGHSIDDIELVIVTHQHIDHLGLVEIVVEHSGAEVAAIGVAAERFANFDEDADAEDQFAVELMLRSGIPAETAEALQSVSRSFRSWGSEFKVTRPLADGEEIAFGERTLQAFHRPGHSPSDTVFWDPERRILIAADHLLSHISSNPLISRPLDGSDQRTQALVTYIDSLRKTREMPAEFVLGGHGEPIVDHVALIDRRIAKHEQRKEKIFGLIEERPRTGHEIAQAIWGNVAVTPGLPHPLRGDRPRRPAGQRGSGA